MELYRASAELLLRKVHLDACTEMCNGVFQCSDFAQKFQNMNSFVSLSRERFSVLDASGVGCVSCVWSYEAGQFWSLLPRSRALCGSVAHCSQAARSSLRSSEPSMELMQAKLVRLLSKTLYWFDVFSLQLDYAAASAPDWVLIPVVPRPQQKLLKCQEVQIKLSFADFNQMFSSRCR